jgi:acetolactate synthase-1/3 small subunit
MKIQHGEAERHVLAITVDNEAGILAKIAGLFTARGYNIDSLTVADISEDHAISRITIVTSGPPPVIDQIIAQLERLVPVHKVVDLTEAGAHVERELALVKVSGKGDNRVEALRIADVFRAKVVDTTSGADRYRPRPARQRLRLHPPLVGPHAPRRLPPGRNPVDVGAVRPDRRARTQHGSAGG